VDYAPDGSVESVDGMDLLFHRMVEDLPLAEGESRELLEAEVRKQFGDAAMREMVGGLSTGLPGRRVDPGESWTWQRRLRALLPMTLDYVSTLAGGTEARASIALAGTISPHEGAAPVTFGPLVLEGSFSGSIKGTVDVDPATGLPLAEDVTQVIAGNVTVAVEGAPPVANPVRIASRRTLKRLE